MLFYFTVTLDKARIALLFLRESFVINFPTRDCTIFRKPACFPSRVSHTVYVVAQEVLQSTGGARCVFAMRSRNVGSFSGFLIELSHNLSQSFCEVVRSVLEDSDFLPLDSDTSCENGETDSASANFVPNRRWNFRELVRNPVRTNGMISKFSLSNGRRCCATRKTTLELNIVGSCCCIVLLVKKSYNC